MKHFPACLLFLLATACLLIVGGCSTHETGSNRARTVSVDRPQRGQSGNPRADRTARRPESRGGLQRASDTSSASLPDPIPLYLDFIQEVYGRIRGPALRKAGSKHEPNQYLFARREAFHYRIHGRSRYAENALRFIEGDYAWLTRGPGRDEDRATFADRLLASAQAWNWIRSSPAVGERERQLARRWLLLQADRYERWHEGTGNRGIGSMSAAMVLDHFFPDAPERETRHRYLRDNWNRWWPAADTGENSSHYNALTWNFLRIALEIKGLNRIWKREEMKQLSERYLAQLTPVGAMPGYGDTVGFNATPGPWIVQMEHWGAIHRDGRFRWAAARMFDYFDAHLDDYRRWGNPVYEVMDSLMDACLIADRTVHPRRPTMGSVVTSRAEQRFVTVDGRPGELTDGRMPDKLIFRTGWDRDDTYALIELAPPMDHGHVDTGSINCMVAKGSVLLADTPYLVRSHPFHNALIAMPGSRPKGWNWYRQVQRSNLIRTQVEKFAAAGDLACATVRIQNYAGQPITAMRHFLFLGRHGLVIVDVVRAEERFKGALGPAFQFTELKTADDGRTVVGRLGRLEVPQIWEDKLLMAHRNPRGALLTWFAPNGNAEVRVDDVSIDRSQWIVDRPIRNSHARRAWQRAEVQLDRGDSVRFHTLAMPLESADQPAPRVWVAACAGEGILLKIDAGRRRTLWAGINPSGQEIAGQGVSTDARFLVLQTGEDSSPSWWLVDGTRLEYGGRRLFASDSGRTDARHWP